MSSDTASVNFTGVQNLFAVVTRHCLHQPWRDPNLSQHRTAFQFDVPKAADVTLEIQHSSGQLVRSLVAGLQQRGRHTVIWDHTDQSGGRVAAGVYFVRMRAGPFRASRQFVVS